MDTAIKMISLDDSFKELIGLFYCKWVVLIACLLAIVLIGLLVGN